MTNCLKHGYWIKTSNFYSECPKCSLEKQIKECEEIIKKQNYFIKNLKNELNKGSFKG